MMFGNIFFDAIKHAMIKCKKNKNAMISNNKGSRIIVTTKMMHVAEYFKKTFQVHIHKLQLVSKEIIGTFLQQGILREVSYRSLMKCPMKLFQNIEGCHWSSIDKGKNHV
jgi:hypothetical protein